MQETTAAAAVHALAARQRELLVGIALTRETLVEHERELAEVRAKLHGIQLGQQVAADAIYAAAQEQPADD